MNDPEKQRQELNKAERIPVGKVKLIADEYKGMSHKNEDDSGGSCGYYEVQVEIQHLYHEGKYPYLAECGEIGEALELTPTEANIMKEIWRTAAARKGKKKKGNNDIRAAEKIIFFGKRLLIKAEYESALRHLKAKERLENI